VIERIVAWYRIGSSAAALVALLVANAIPLLGVLFLGWNVWTILIVYWLENGIVGVINVLKMLYAEGEPDEKSAAAAQGQGKAMMIPFFVMHYGIFWLVHGVFILTLPLFAGIGGDSDMAQGVSVGAIVVAVIALCISHGLSFWWNFLVRGEYRRTSAAAQLFAPYGRLVVLHLTIIVGALAISFTGASAAAVAVLVVLKTVLDVGFHLTEHRRIEASPATPVIQG